MLKVRLIPVLFLKDGYLVRSETFNTHQNLGNPIAQVKRYNLWNVDELIYIDISESDLYSKKRLDMGEEDIPSNISELITVVSKNCFMPLTFGGKIRTLDDISLRMSLGADKVSINTQAYVEPGFIDRSSKKFGSQAIVVSIDFKLNDRGENKVYINRGTEETEYTPEEWAKEVERRGAGEILLNSIDKDGLASGYNARVIKSVVSSTKIPIIACGGVGEYSDFIQGIEEGKADAVAAGNIFHFRELSYPLAKKFLKGKGLNFR